MIAIDLREGPLILCDHCGGEIRDTASAIVTWKAEATAHHVHKGACDLNRDPNDPDTHWWPLDSYLRRLVRNVGLKGKLEARASTGTRAVVVPDTDDCPF